MESWAMEALGLVLMTGGLYALWHEREVKRRAESARYWPRAEGRIVASELRLVGSRPDVEAFIAYEYDVAGKRLSGQAVAVGERTLSESEAAKRRLTRYPEGTPVEVLYNPENPFEAYLEARDTLSLAYPFVAGGIAVAGGLLLGGQLPLL